MSIINNGLLLASGADAPTTYQISRSIRLNSADSAYFSRTPGSAGNQKTYTLSMWIKRSKLGQKYFFGSYYSNLSRYQYLGFNSSDQLEFFGGVYTTGGSTTTHVNLSTTAVYRDVSAWYHLVLAVDTTQATNTNRVKLYVNGTQITDFGTATYPAQNSESYINSVQAHYLGDWGGGGSISLDGYIADVYLLDGTATTPSTFAETDAITGQWVPKTPASISYGTNGFRLTFSDNSGTTSTTLGKDSAGSNNWTPNNFSVASGSGNDSLVDTPTSYGTDTGAGGEVRGNYATLNPLDQVSTTLTNGNLDASIAGAATAMTVCGSIAVTTGKWYWEVTATSSNLAVGVQQSNFFSTSLFAKGVSYYSVSGEKYVDGSASSYGSSFTTNDVIGIALNLDSGTVQFYKNNTAQGSISLPTSNSGWKPAITNGTSGGTNSAVANFGQRAFAYTAPSGFKALCDTNLTAPTIAKPADYFDITLWTGNSTNGRAITGLAFQPEFVWIKRRSASYSNLLFDAVRGFGGTGWTKQLISDSTAAEDTGTTNTISSFDTGGFTLGTDGGVNSSGSTYVGWCWDAAGSNSTNTQGSITSTVRANATAGFSIVTYTGTGANATVGHGCGAAPSMMLVKSRSAANGWAVYHASIGNTYELILNSTSAVSGPNGTYWNSTSPTSTVFSLGTDSWGNANGGTYVAYCFSPVANFSAFGSYTGNGSSTDGPFVFTGHRSRWLMVKRTDVANEWTILDTARSTYNEAKAELYPSASAAEGANGGPVDINSNGFKLRTTASNWNTSSGTYIYASFAEFPFAYARAR